MKASLPLTPRHRIFLFLCCALSLLSLLIPLDGVQSILFESTPWACVLAAVIAAVCLWFIYRKWICMERPFAHGCLWVLAFLFPIIIMLGKSFLALGTTELLTLSTHQTILFFIGRVPLYFAVMQLIYQALRGKRYAGTGRHHALFYALELFICWLHYWVMTFPGTISNDSITQLKEILGIIPMSNGNPVFQTWLISLFLGISKWFQNTDVMIALYCATQAILMAWLLGAFLAEMARSAAPRWLLWGSAVFYALCPIFPSFAFCIGKDTNFAMAVLYFTLSIWHVLRLGQGERIRPAQIVSLCIAAALCILLRNPGVYLVLLTLLILLLWTLRKKRRSSRLWVAPASALGTLICVYGALHFIIIPTLSIAPTPETESYSLPLQQVARVVASQSLSQEEAAAIDSVLVLDELKTSYNAELSDPVKLLWRDDATKEQKELFWKTWLTLIKKYPATCFAATFHNTYGYLYPGYISTIKPTLLIGDQSTRTANLEGVLSYSVNPNAQKLKSFTDSLTDFTPYRLLISPGLYGWIVLFAAACLCHQKDRRNLIAAVPALFTLVGCVLSAVNGYFRYAMPLYLIAPFLLWLCSEPLPEKPNDLT